MGPWRHGRGQGGRGSPDFGEGVASGENKGTMEREEVTAHLLMYLYRVWDALRWLVGEEQGAAVKVSGGAGVPARDWRG